jgi:hypothetical protein
MSKEVNRELSFINKPVSFEDLMARIEQQLGDKS